MKTTLTLMKYVLRAPEGEGAAGGGAPANEPSTSGEGAPPANEPPPAEDNFGWDLEGNTEPPEGGEATPPEGDYTLDWEAHPMPEGIRDTLTDIGRESGVAPEAFLPLVERLDEMLATQKQSALRAEGDALKAQWGSDFDGNAKMASAAMRDFARSIGVEPQAFADSFPPTKANMMLMHRFAQLQSGGSRVDGQQQTSTEKWDTGSELYQAWINPSHPKHREARAQRAQYNMGN